LIFLNALAIPDIERRANAITSIGSQFSGAVSARTSGINTVSGYAPEVSNEVAATSLSERYATIVSMADTGGILAATDASTFLLSLSGDTLFSPHDAQLAARTLPALRRITKEFNTRPLFASVAVHTAATDASDSTEALKSSLAEAGSLARFFLDAGIAPERIDFHAHGDRIPLMSNSASDGRAANHRVEIRLLDPGEPYER
jgi:flagellar motor protein MotB